MNNALMEQIRTILCNKGTHPAAAAQIAAAISADSRLYEGTAERYSDLLETKESEVISNVCK